MIFNKDFKLDSIYEEDFNPKQKLIDFTEFYEQGSTAHSSMKGSSAMRDSIMEPESSRRQ